ncbi:MAG: DUF6265 family protein [Pseudomonadota bacterium]
MVSALLIAACSHSPSVQNDADSAPFYWMEGCWQSESGSTQEIWTQSYAGFVFGHSVTYRDGKLVFFEDLRVETRGDESVYFASPGGTSPVQFSMSEYADGGATFINPSHDDPQRITYARSGNDLTVVISMMDGSNVRTFSFSACAPG